MARKTYNWSIDQGATVTLPVFQWQYESNGVWYNYDLTNYTARMQVRSTPSSDTVVLECTTANGRLQIDGPNGAVTPVIPDSVTAALTPGVYAYDLEVVSALGAVTPLVGGAFVVGPEVTR